MGKFSKKLKAAEAKKELEAAAQVALLQLQELPYINRHWLEMRVFFEEWEEVLHVQQIIEKIKIFSRWNYNKWATFHPGGGSGYKGIRSEERPAVFALVKKEFKQYSQEEIGDYAGLDLKMLVRLVELEIESHTMELAFEEADQ